ncbi:MAG: hypothetical protein M3Y12_08555 [Bacteroidota bacterium]|nr:hypothetical protein [Bacteroidota bacterium]
MSSVNKNQFLRAMASPAGRLARVALGAGLIGLGLGRGQKGWPLAALGLLPLSMGAFDLSALAPLAGLPVQGEQLRDVLNDDSDYYLAHIGTL